MQRNGRQVSQLLGDFANGRDEMNLVEFPLALLSERAPEGLLTLECSDEIEERGVTIQRQVIVAATAKYGLPTAKDEDVLMGLLQLAKIHNEFTNPVVSFTRLQLIKLLGWENTRWSYDRIALALDRWQSVSITYRKAWRDNRDRQWQDKSGFGLIDSYGLRDSRRVTRGGRGGGAADGGPLVVPLEWLPLQQLPVGLSEEAQLQDLPQAGAAGGQAALPLPGQAFLRAAPGRPGIRAAGAGLRAPGHEPALRQHADPAGAPAGHRGARRDRLHRAEAGRDRYKRLARGRWQVEFSKKLGEQDGKRKPQTSPQPASKTGRADRRRTSEQEVENQRVGAYLASQTEERRGELERQALATATTFLRQNYESRKGEGGPLFEECRRLIIHQHVLRLLAEAGQSG
jgi:hypothetical protein